MTDIEHQTIRHALELLADHAANRPDEYSDEECAALRKLIAEYR